MMPSPQASTSFDYDNRSLVLRKQPPGDLLPSAHAIDREYRVMQVLAGTDAPVPRMILLHAGREIVGTAFCLMERLAGERSRRWKGVRRIRHR